MITQFCELDRSFPQNAFHKSEKGDLYKLEIIVSMKQRKEN